MKLKLIKHITKSESTTRSSVKLAKDSSFINKKKFEQGISIIPKSKSITLVIGGLADNMLFLIDFYFNRLHRHLFKRLPQFDTLF